MAALWWKWDRITTLDSISDVYNALIKNKSYHDVQLQHGGDVFAKRGSVSVAVLFLNASVPYAPPPPPPSTGGTGSTGSYGGGPFTWWRGIACSGASHSEAEAIFREIRALKLQKYATL